MSHDGTGRERFMMYYSLVKVISEFVLPHTTKGDRRRGIGKSLEILVPMNQ